ncbi:hypothetical protein BDZ89DRAFT_409872 [Hymenopellis radicata]|nr:hypothetical protein BDZ89DRAFT_409872 [Hymenopellis radicata]
MSFVVWSNIFIVSPNILHCRSSTSVHLTWNLCYAHSQTQRTASQTTPSPVTSRSGATPRGTTARMALRARLLLRNPRCTLRRRGGCVLLRTPPADAPAQSPQLHLPCRHFCQLTNDCWVAF